MGKRIICKNTKWKREIRKSGNLEEEKVGKIDFGKKENKEKGLGKGKLSSIKENRKNKEIWINKNRE